MKLEPFHFSALENTPTVQTCISHGNNISLHCQFLPPQMPSLSLRVSSSDLRVVWQTGSAWGIKSEVEVQERPPSCPQEADVGPDILNPKPVHWNTNSCPHVQTQRRHQLPRWTRCGFFFGKSEWRVKLPAGLWPPGTECLPLIQERARSPGTERKAGRFSRGKGKVQSIKGETNKTLHGP